MKTHKAPKRRRGIPTPSWPQLRVTTDDGYHLFEVHVIDSAQEDRELDHLTCKLQDSGRGTNVHTVPASGSLEEVIKSWTAKGYKHLAGFVHGALPSN